MDIEKTVDYIQLKAIFDQLFDKVSKNIEVPPKIEKPKTEKQLENMRKRVLLEKLMKIRE
jgi:hypothetical protein